MIQSVLSSLVWHCFTDVITDRVLFCSKILWIQGQYHVLHQQSTTEKQDIDIWSWFVDSSRGVQIDHGKDKQHQSLFIL